LQKEKEKRPLRCSRSNGTVKRREGRDFVKKKAPEDRAKVDT